jgi:cytochrome P450
MASVDADVQPWQVDAILGELLLTPEGRRDPYPRYKRIRDLAPVHRSGFGPLVLTRYADCQAALRDHRLGKGERDMDSPVAGMGGTSNFSEELVAKMREEQAKGVRVMLTADPPDHTRLRRLVSRAFTPSRVDALRAEVERMVDHYCDELADAGEAGADVIGVLGFPLPVNVIGELLGVPEADRQGFQPVVQKVVKALELTTTEPELWEALEGQEQLSSYFEDLVAERTARPRDDLLTAMVQARDEDDRLTTGEIVMTAILLFAAGFETTTNMIGNGLYALLTHPDQLDRLYADPGMAPTAVEELLRWDSPVQLDGRAVLEPAEVAGVEVKQGDFVITLLGAANRDPEHYTDPETLDVGRDEGAPLSFASGIHYCLGAGLARMEGDVVLRGLLRRFRSMELLDEDAERRTGLTLRGFAHLPVRFVAA